MDLEKKDGQLATEPSEAKQPEANNDFSKDTEITLGNGTKVTLDELEKGYLRQSDYTKKTQELASKKQELELSDEDLKAIDLLKKAGFTTVDDINNFKKEQANKEELTNFIGNTDLSENQLKVVRDLKQIYPDKPLAEIAKEYGIIDEAKMNKVKGSYGFKGNSFALPAKEEPYKVDVTKAGYNPEKAAQVAKMKF